ncbi:MAG: hypothetical protein HQL87_05775 [Magnetococcales bacterium]|nr:hypothetical protein [Magnetococcales bacterium]
MNWTTASDLKEQLRRLWERGELLRSLVNTEPCFPKRLTLKVPNSNALADRFDAVRAWIGEVTTLPQIRIEWREFRHGVLGAQRVPQAAWVDKLDDALHLIGKRSEAARFTKLLARTRSQQPALLPWLDKRPLPALALADDWERLLSVLEWIAQHPHSGLYLRQVNIASIHTKFIESHRGVLSEWLDLVLPATAIRAEQTGVGQFATRYGFLDKPTHIRFRLLDERVPLLPGPCRPDVALDAESFSLLSMPIRRVFVTENEINFLAFPPAPDAIVVFGAGYALDALAKAAWLRGCAIHYWGDIDTHGFSILNKLRSHFNHVHSFLMDRSTLMAHAELWGEEVNQCLSDLPWLDAGERALFDDLRDNRIRQGLRLEQERVGFLWVEETLAGLLEQDRTAIYKGDSWQ